MQALKLIRKCFGTHIKTSIVFLHSSLKHCLLLWFYASLKKIVAVLRSWSFKIGTYLMRHLKQPYSFSELCREMFCVVFVIPNIVGQRKQLLLSALLLLFYFLQHSWIPKLNIELYRGLYYWLNDHLAHYGLNFSVLSALGLDKNLVELKQRI